MRWLGREPTATTFTMPPHRSPPLIATGHHAGSPCRCKDGGGGLPLLLSLPPPCFSTQGRAWEGIHAADDGSDGCADCRILHPKDQISPPPPLGLDLRGFASFGGKERLPFAPVGWGRSGRCRRRHHPAVSMWTCRLDASNGLDP